MDLCGNAPLQSVWRCCLSADSVCGGGHGHCLSHTHTHTPSTAMHSLTRPHTVVRFQPLLHLTDVSLFSYFLLPAILVVSRCADGEHVSAGNPATARPADAVFGGDCGPPNTGTRWRRRRRSWRHFGPHRPPRNVQGVCLCVCVSVSVSEPVFVLVCVCVCVC